MKTGEKDDGGENLDKRTSASGKEDILRFHDDWLQNCEWVQERVTGD